MGTNTIQQAVAGKVGNDRFNDQFVTALLGDFVPRSSGAPTDGAGSLGTPTFKWKRLNVASGHGAVGDIINHHTYGGNVPIPQGWMICDGSVVNETNYDAQHSAGDWDTYITASNLEGKNLPDFAGKYPVGTDAVTQDGSSPITSSGNSSNTINIQHTHDGAGHDHSFPAHHHPWQEGSGDMSGFQNSGNSQIDWIDKDNDAGVGDEHIAIASGSATGADGVFDQSAFTENSYREIPLNTSGVDSDTTDSAGSATQGIQPESIESLFIIKIV